MLGGVGVGSGVGSVRSFSRRCAIAFGSYRSISAWKGLESCCVQLLGSH